MDIFCELGRIYFRRAYRMTIESFWKLYRLVSDSIKVSMKSSTKNRKRYVPNGPVHPSVILACGLRLFAGVSKYDLATTFGISVTYVEYSMNWVIDAVVNCNNLKVVFPDCHLKQKKLAKEFEKKSTPGFKNCVGAIDGMLVWIEKPHSKECGLSTVDDGKFYCHRKGKYGLNLQAVCDAQR